MIVYSLRPSVNTKKKNKQAERIDIEKNKINFISLKILYFRKQYLVWPKRAYPVLSL